MLRKKLEKIGVMIAAALLISACSTGIQGQQEKIAVINWEKAAAEHPDFTKLEQGEKILKDLLLKRKQQELMSKAQFGSLNKLRALRQLSQQSYLDADFNTRMVEQRERENIKLQKVLVQAEAEADAQLASQRKAVEDSFQLKIFNLRARLESVEIKPDERKALETELRKVQHERGTKIAQLQAEKQKLVEAKVLPYKAAAEQRMRDTAAKYHAEMRKEIQVSEERDTKLLSTAPKALSSALSIMDREIDKQQEKNDNLKKKIHQDIESQAVRLAHERGYTVVFKQYQVNLKAEDITADIVQNLKKDKNKL